MTLVELLMVISIMTILMAIAIPLIRPAFQDRQLREASRQINAFCAGAKARAAETGRPVGVWIEAAGAPGEPQYAVRLYLAEVSGNFTGEVLGARATVEVDATGAWLNFGDSLGTPASFSRLSPILQALLLDDEKFFIRFDHKGPTYSCKRMGTGYQIAIPSGIVPRGTEHPPFSIGPQAGLTFEITRSPSKSIVAPLTLPGDSVIDLNLSGIGINSTANIFQAALPTAPVIIMFSPAGLTGAVFVDNTEYVAGGSVYLFIGRRAKVIDPALAATVDDPELSNLADPANFWLTINHRTGAVTTEVNAVSPPAPSVVDRIKAAREFARGSRQKGGR